MTPNTPNRPIIRSATQSQGRKRSHHDRHCKVILPPIGGCTTVYHIPTAALVSHPRYVHKRRDTHTPPSPPSAAGEKTTSPLLCTPVKVDLSSWNRTLSATVAAPVLPSEYVEAEKIREGRKMITRCSVSLLNRTSTLVYKNH